MAVSRVTRDHNEIRRWAKEHGAEPAKVKGMANRRGTGVLRFLFPEGAERHERRLTQISWEEFFERFDRNRLELVYEERNQEGEDRLGELMQPGKRAARRRGRAN